MMEKFNFLLFRSTSTQIKSLLGSYDPFYTKGKFLIIGRINLLKKFIFAVKILLKYCFTYYECPMFRFKS